MTTKPLFRNTPQADDSVTLIPIAMRRPSALFVHQVSRFRPSKTVTRQFLEGRYGRPTMIKVSLTDDIGDWQELPAYSFGLGGWHIVGEADLCQS